MDTDLMSRIHKEQRRRKHKRSYSDQPASPMDQFSYDPNQTGDADLLVIPDTPSPIFNGRKTKVKLTGKFTPPVSAAVIYKHPFCDVKKQHKPMNENSLNYDLSPNDVASDASPEIDYHHGSVQLKDVSPRKVESAPRLKKWRSLENDIADVDHVACEASPEVDDHHGSVRLKDGSPKKVKLTSSLEKQRSPEKCATSETIDITNSKDAVDSDSTDVYFVEESASDVLILSSEAASSSESAIHTSGCSQNESGSNHTVTHKRSPKKRLFQNGVRELVETDTLCSYHDRHRLYQKQRIAGERSQLKTCLNGDRHSKSSRHREDVHSFCRVAGHTEVTPSSTHSPITSPPSKLSGKSFHHRKHHAKPHHSKHSSGTDWDSLSAASVLPCKGNRHASRTTGEVTCFPSFQPASSLIDLTETPVHMPKHDMKSWTSSAFHVTSEFTSPSRRHKHPHRKSHGREKRNSNGSDARMANALSQVEQDEAMARRLQEEMDRDFALSLVESENRTMAYSSTSPDLPRDLADNLDHVISDLEMSASTVIDYGPVHVQSRGTQACVSVTNTGGVVSVGFTNSRPRTRGRRGGGQRRNRVIEYYEPEQSDGNDYEFLLGLAEQIGDVTTNVGLCRQHIDLLPQRLYSGPQTGRDTSCNICMCDYETGDNLRMLPCFHEFHQPCIDTWIKKNATCPICRVDIEVGQS